MFRYFVGSVTGLLLVALATPADAQIVRIGPYGGVSIRAPFVAVDTSPWGGARVRAPFTAVDTGVYGGYYPVHPRLGYVVPAPAVVYPPVVEVPVPVYEPVPVQVYPPVEPYSASRPVGSSDPILLAEQLRAAALQLGESLNRRRDDGDVWLKYLGPGQIVDAVDRRVDPQSLKSLLANYDGVVGNGQLGSIRAARGFSETRALLRQYIQQGAAPTVAEPQQPVPPLEPREAPQQPIQPADGPEQLPVPPPPADDLDAGVRESEPGELVRRPAPTPI